MIQNRRFSKNMILNIIIIALCFILFLSATVLVIRVVQYQRRYTNSEDILLNQLRYRDYHYLTEAVYENEALNVPPDKDMAGLYAVAHYYENAMLFYAHQTVGNEEQAKRRYEKMQEYEEQFGEYGYVIEEIWDYLEEKAGR